MHPSSFSAFPAISTTIAARLKRRCQKMRCGKGDRSQVDGEMTPSIPDVTFRSRGKIFLGDAVTQSPTTPLLFRYAPAELSC